MQLTYRGAHAAIEIPHMGVTVAQGDTIDVDDETVAASLIRVGFAATEKPTKKPTKKDDKS